jgi:hypothetical protein
MIAVARPVDRRFFWRPLLQDAHDEMVLAVALSGKSGSVSYSCCYGYTVAAFSSHVNRAANSLAVMILVVL